MATLLSDSIESEAARARLVNRHNGCTARDGGVFELVRVLIALAVAPLFHVWRRRVAQVQRDGIGQRLLHVVLDAS